MSESDAAGTEQEVAVVREIAQTFADEVHSYMGERLKAIVSKP